MKSHYGSNAYGIESAAGTFFGKSASELNLAESAYLASLPKAPTFFSPYGSNTEALDARQDTVLSLMEQEGYITTEEAEEARNTEVAFVQPIEDIKAPHFVFHVREELVELFGQKRVEQGGLQVITSLDMTKQAIAEEEIQNGRAVIEARGGSNAALVSIAPNSGEILAMVGSVDYFDTEAEGNVNVTTRLRQPGSSFKPYAYAAAFEAGYTPQTQVYDLNTDFGNGYRPKNYDLSQSGPISLESALARSKNTPAVKAGYLVGPENVAAFARKLGVGNLPEDGEYGLATPLGVQEVQLLEHVNGIGVFANQGKFNDPTSILKVTDAEDKVLQDYEPKNEEVIDANLANTMNRILSTDSLRAPSFGSGTILTLGGRPVAAKTGTTNDFKDALTVGYTPSLVTGVWVGNNSGEVMGSGAAGFTVAAPIWNSYMRRALEGSPVESFEAPVPLSAPNSTLQGKLGIGDPVAIDKPTGTLWSESCPAENRVEITFGAGHNILHYINKDNPTGGPPSNPKNDPQYSNWEKAVAGFAGEEDSEFSTEDPPTETCDAFYEDDSTISITSPANGEAVSGVITVVTNASSSRGVKNVQLFVDGVLKGTDTTPVFQLTYDTTSLTDGVHTLTVRLTDTAGNIKNDSISVNVSNAAAVVPAAPTIDAVITPTGDVTQLITGTKPAGVAVYINGIDVTGFTAATTWSYNAPLNLGLNTFTAKSVDSDGLESGTTSVDITRI